MIMFKLRSKKMNCLVSLGEYEEYCNRYSAGDGLPFICMTVFQFHSKLKRGDQYRSQVHCKYSYRLIQTLSRVIQTL